MASNSTSSDSSTGLFDMKLIQNLANIQWASTGDSTLALQVATTQLVGDLYNKLSGEKEMEALRAETILRISKYVKDNPKASKEKLTKEVAKEIEMFAKKVSGSS